ncbi:nuclear transport factor 2 family protein [Piscibacillus halophilus]|uniref:Ketosteroid isomerase-related protein n=1 Tax=Piscibacillus halophilus TaxID=571933 RepID=A0A1H9CD60_9BACI|nr:nuclear transport factor 2 family protein [Piscibacillus halophilus]SEP99084.1 Ketosteroid isomerase-related protein [Piscibacillus halophilus]
MATERQKFFEEFNQAFMTGDVDFILDSVTDDVRWEMVGDDMIVGKEALREALGGVKTNDTFKLTIYNTITHGTAASVNGVITFTTKEGEHKKFGFCDVYRLSSHKSGKIKELTSYVVEMN